MNTADRAEVAPFRADIHNAITRKRIRTVSEATERPDSFATLQGVASLTVLIRFRVSEKKLIPFQFQNH